MGETIKGAAATSGADTPEEFDLLGVGVGPSNLSLAALLAPIGGIRARFLERKPEFRWHPGLMLPEASTQVHYLKDLVTLIDPSSRFSFVAFLNAHKRLYRAIIADRMHASRVEFDEYYRWVASGLNTLRFGARVDGIEWDGRSFVVWAAEEALRSRHLVLATGLQPCVPGCARAHLGADVFHTADFLTQVRSFKGRRVAVIGGGQSGAEVVYHLLCLSGDRPESVQWV